MTVGFPHSDISGSKVIWHLTESYRSHITSFIASWSQGIHHTPFVPIGNVIHRCIICCRELRSRHLSVDRRYILRSIALHWRLLVSVKCVCCVSGTKRPERLQHQTHFLTRHTTYSRAWIYKIPHTGICLPGVDSTAGLFRRQVLSTCPLEYENVKYRVPPLNFVKKKTAVSRQVKTHCANHLLRRCLNSKTHKYVMAIL